MKLFKYILFIIFYLFTSCSSKEKVEETIKNTSQENKETLSASKRPITKNYEPSSVCACSNDGLKALNDMLSIRQRYQDFETYNDDYASVEKVANLQDRWVMIRNTCLRKFASKLFVPSNCNEPEKIGYFKDKLYKLGIDSI